MEVLSNPVLPVEEQLNIEVSQDQSAEAQAQVAEMATKANAMTGQELLDEVAANQPTEVVNPVVIVSVTEVVPVKQASDVEADAAAKNEKLIVAEVSTEKPKVVAEPVEVVTAKTVEEAPIGFDNHSAPIKPEGKYNEISVFKEYVDVSDGGDVVITAANCGPDGRGTYTDCDTPASVHLNGVYLGEGITKDQVLEMAIAKGAVPAGATFDQLETLGNDLVTYVNVPGQGLVKIGQLTGVENWSGKITSGTFNIVKELQAQGVDTSKLDLSNVELVMKEIGAGHGSLDENVQVVKQPVVTTTTTVPETTTTTVPETTTTTIPEVTTTVPETTTTVVEVTTTIPEVTTTTVHEGIPSISIERHVDVPEQLAVTGYDAGSMAITGLTMAVAGAITMAGVRARKLMQR